MPLNPAKVVAISIYAIAALLWGTIFAIYLHQRTPLKKRDRVIAMLLSVLALDALRSTFENVYFGLAWGSQFGVVPSRFAVLASHRPMMVAKSLTLIVALVILSRIARNWVPAELAERERLHREEARLRAQLLESLQQAQVAEQRFRLAADAGQNAVWDRTLATGDTWVSPRFREIVGHDEASWTAAGLTFCQVVHPEDAATFEAAYKAIFEGAANELDLVHRLRHRDGSMRWVRTHGVLVRGDTGEPQRLLGYSRDVTDELAADEARQQAQKLESLGLLAGGIAHDFNNLLTVISANVSTLQAELGAAAEPAAAATLSAVERATALTRQLLAYGGKARLVREELDLGELVTSISQLLAVAVSKKTRLTVDVRSGAAGVLADAAQLQQVVMNLVSNAAEAIGDAEGTISLETDLVELDEASARSFDPGGGLKSGRYSLLRVRDSGRGMTPEVRSRIFDPFFSTKGPGRGMGLSGMLGTLRAHGGGVRLESTPGRGSTFEVVLPALAAPARSRRALARPASATLAANVLLVDDEELVLRSSARLLRTLGVQVQVAKNGAEAVRMIRESPRAFDAVLLDLTMPEMSGVEALTHIRAIRGDLPVVLTSGFSEARLEPQPFTSFLAKPYDRSQVEGALRAALEPGRT